MRVRIVNCRIENFRGIEALRQNAKDGEALPQKNWEKSTTKLFSHQHATFALLPTFLVQGILHVRRVVGTARAGQLIHGRSQFGVVAVVGGVNSADAIADGNSPE